MKKPKRRGAQLEDKNCIKLVLAERACAREKKKTKTTLYDMQSQTDRLYSRLVYYNITALSGFLAPSEAVLFMRTMNFYGQCEKGKTLFRNPEKEPPRSNLKLECLCLCPREEQRPVCAKV